MSMIREIKEKYHNVLDINEKGGLFRISAPFFHEDGDMYELFAIEQDGIIKIFDNGLSLMRLSYSFDLNTENKINTFNKILFENQIQNEKGNLFVYANSEDFIEKLNTFCIGVSKVTNLNILAKEVVSSLFFEYVEEFMLKKVRSKFAVEKDYNPPGSSMLPNNYRIDLPVPIYIFPVKDNLTASRAANGCGILKKIEKRFESIGVCEEVDALSKLDRYILMETADKVYPKFGSFEENGLDYIISRAG